MTRLRSLLHAHGWIAAMIVAAVLALRVMVPAGTMPTIENRSLAITICTGMGPAEGALAIPVDKQHPSGAERCAFADLAMPLLGGAEPVLLAAALAFILALWLAHLPALPQRRDARLRPPLRGPPIRA